MQRCPALRLPIDSRLAVSQGLLCVTLRCLSGPSSSSSSTPCAGTSRLSLYAASRVEVPSEPQGEDVCRSMEDEEFP